jgi:hypothetical protein
MKRHYAFAELRPVEHARRMSRGWLKVGTSSTAIAGRTDVDRPDQSDAD